MNDETSFISLRKRDLYLDGDITDCKEEKLKLSKRKVLYKFIIEIQRDTMESRAVAGGS